MNNFKRVLAVSILLVILSFTLVSCTSNKNVQENLEENTKKEEFSLVNPSEIGEKDYWELARTFNQLSVEFINAVYSKDTIKIQELINSEISLDIAVKEKQNVNHIKQQTVVYENGKYNSIMQFGIEDEPYRYFHIFFEDMNDEWKICDVQMDA